MKVKKIKIYSSPTCIFCKMVKEFFDEKGVKYEEANVVGDSKACDEAIKKSGQRGVPVIDIDGQIVTGFDEEKICEILGI